MEQWDLARPTGVCTVTGRELREGEEYYAVLFEDQDSLRRVDCCLEAWNGPPEGAFCHFKTRVPVREAAKKPLLVDNDMLVNLFLRLADQTEPLRLQFRFALALILMRKRLLRYEETIYDSGAEYWLMRLAREQSTHRVLNPHLTDEQAEGVSRQLGAILQGDILEGLDLDQEDGPGPAGSMPETTTPAPAGDAGSQPQDRGTDA